MVSDEPDSVRIRMYNVGFGDCFLLSFVYADSSSHVLIDFGTMGLPKVNGEPLHTTSDVAAQIERECGADGLTAVVATHRHQDHIRGFSGSSGAIIEQLQPELVLQPWTEQPDLERDATSPSQLTAARFSLMDRDLRQVLQDHKILVGDDAGDLDSARLDDAVDSFVARTRHVAKNGARDLVYLGNNNIKNWSAIKRLNRMGKQAEYLVAGKPTGLEVLLPGVKVHVLGPPTVDESDIVSQVAAHATEFWHMSASRWGTGLRGAGAASVDDAEERFAVATEPPVPVQSRWLADRLAHVRPRDLLAIVRDLDGALNNTSLVLLFEVWSQDDRKLLLFPGDAQIESWRHCFEGLDTAAYLPDVDVYKVGHHGSLNATPKVSLWEPFRKRGDGRELVTLLSTMDGRHGHEENDTEVPRTPLVEALAAETKLLDSRVLADSKNPMYIDHVVEPSSRS